jgi:hypothetical protein
MERFDTSSKAGEIIRKRRDWARVDRVGRRAKAAEPLAFRVGEELDGHGGLLRGASPQSFSQMKVSKKTLCNG